MQRKIQAARQKQYERSEEKENRNSELGKRTGE